MWIRDGVRLKMTRLQHIAAINTNNCHTNTPAPEATNPRKTPSLSPPDPCYPYEMFNALNRFISRLDGEDPRQKQQQGLFGFQVLRNTNLQLAIEPWFDFIVGINGRMIVRPLCV